MKQKLSLWMTFVLTLVCTGILGFVGIYAINKQMPMWFGVYVSSGVDTRVEIAIDNYEFTPIFDNVNKNFTSTLTDKGMYRVGDKIFLPLTNLDNTSVFRLKIYNYSKTEALNAEVVDGNLNMMDSTYGVSSSYMENLRPMPTTATLAADTVPYDIVNFQVNCLYKNTQVNLTLKLETTTTSNINTIAQTYEIEGNQTLPSYNVGRYVDYYYNSQIADINTTGGNNFGIDSGFTYATTDADGDAVTPSQAFKYFVQVGEYPQTVVTYDSALDLITPLGSNYTTTTASTLDLDNDGVAEIMPIGTTFVCEKSYQQYINIGLNSAEQFDIYQYSVTINNKPYKFTNTPQYSFDYVMDEGFDVTYTNDVSVTTVHSTRGWFYVQPINWIVLGGLLEDGTTEIKAYNQDFRYDTQNGFYYITPENKIKNLILCTEVNLDAVQFDREGNTSNWGATASLPESTIKTFLNTTSNNGFLYASNLNRLVGLSNNNIIPQTLTTKIYNGGVATTNVCNNNYIFMFGYDENDSYYDENYFYTKSKNLAYSSDYNLAHFNSQEDPARSVNPIIYNGISNFTKFRSYTYYRTSHQDSGKIWYLGQFGSVGPAETTAGNKGFRPAMVFNFA